MVDETPPPTPQKGVREPDNVFTGKLVAAILGVCAIVAAFILFAGCSSDDASSKNASGDSSSDVTADFDVVGTADQVSQKNLKDCPDKSKYFWAGDAPAHSGAMGPPLVVSENDKGTQIARDRFWLKDKCDPAWTAHAHEGIFVENPENFDPVKAQADAERYNSDADAWQKATDEMFAEIEGYELRDYGTTRYDSVGMIPNPDGPTSKLPTFTKWAEQPELHLVLVVKTKHHGERLFRVDCDLQYSARKLVEFHAPSSVPPPPATVTPPPPSSPPPPPPTNTTPPPPPPTTETMPPKIPTKNPVAPPGIVPLPLPPEDTLQPVPPVLTNRQTVPIPPDAPPVSQVPRPSVPPVVAPVITVQNTPVPVPAPVPMNPGTTVGEPPPIP